MSKRKRFPEWKEFGLSNAVTDPVSLKMLSWKVAGLNGLFLVADTDAHRLECFVTARMFQKAMLVHTNFSRRANSWEDCDAQQSSCIRDGADNQKLLDERADGLQSSWMD